MKFLLLGTLRSIYIQQFIENVLEPLGMEVYMQSPSEDKECTKDFISKHKINFITYHEAKEKKIYKFPYLGSKIKASENIIELIKFKSFNYIHLQFVTLADLIKISILRTKKTKCFVSFWGSDLLRQSKKILKTEYKYLRKMNYLSADSYFMEQKYKEIFPYSKKNLNIIYYGVSVINFIDKFSENINDCKKYFGLSCNKKVIAIGYNAIKQQQHDKVLDALNTINNKDDYIILLQITYGSITDNEYIPKLMKALEKSGFEYKIIKDFLSIEDLAKLRIATDIFINAQTTDAFCNSIKEHMYAKTQVISATWLHYPEIDMFPLYLNEFSEFSEIPELLNQSISNEKLEWNKKIINEKSTWEACRNKWAEIYGVNNK